ncbi:outer membrane beta-barrel protein [Pedobacter jeongneungensis]|uniref:outer membrane beta-barrel protein n=1 Tax=Pedobacter jeongneungensis TaxID=947309 RepID=UPI00046A9EBA|nr:outer membrane beta-barrel protein [Pedobacter jeongneungensis]
MKNSAWYHKLWSKKFDNLPIKDVADASWAGMHKLLNEQMPGGPIGGNPPGVSAGAKLFKILGYVFSAAVTVATVVYVTVPHTKNTKKEIVKENKGRLSDSSLIDSDNVVNYNNIIDSNLINNKDTLNSLAEKNEVGDSRIAKHENQAVATVTKKNDVSIVAALHSVSAPGHQIKGMEKSDPANVAVNLANRQSKHHPAVFSSIDSLDKRRNEELVVSSKFWQDNILQGDAVNQVKNLTSLQPILQLRADYSSLQIASSPKGRDKNKSIGNNSGKNKKTKEIKLSKSKTIKTKPESIGDGEQKYSYGITGGMNVQKSGSSFSAGLFGSYAFDKKWQLVAGVNINSAQKLAREFTHPSYYRPDSLPPFTIADERKVITVDFPLAAAYRLSKKISVKAGPIIAFSIKQSDVFTKLKPIADPRDTLYHGKAVDSALVNTVANKVSIGFMGGISVHIKQFDINGSYQWLKPNKVSNSLGSSNQANQFFRIGIAYRL